MVSYVCVVLCVWFSVSGVSLFLWCVYIGYLVYFRTDCDWFVCAHTHTSIKSKSKSKSKSIAHPLNSPPQTGLKTKFIFQKDGNPSEVWKLRKRFLKAKGKPISLDGVNVHDVATMLKHYLEDLPNSLLTIELHDCFIAAAGVPDPPTRLYCMRKAVSLLPPVCSLSLSLHLSISPSLCRVLSLSLSISLSRSLSFSLFLSVSE
jgi:RhoGAP domain